MKQDFLDFITKLQDEITLSLESLDGEKKFN
jgi:coproporphyrinogen III oxidase